MSRPIYETEHDRQLELSVITTFCHRFDRRYVKHPDKSFADFDILNGDRLTAIAEVKCRNYTWAHIKHMGGLILSARKFDECMLRAATLDVPFILLLRCINGLILYQSFRASDGSPGELSIGGRCDRNDSYDLEPCYIIDLEPFRRVN